MRSFTYVHDKRITLFITNIIVENWMFIDRQILGS